MQRLYSLPPHGLSDLLLLWPFEVFMAITLAGGTIASLLAHSTPVFAIWYGVGPEWAIWWAVLAVTGAILLVVGLYRGDFSALGAGLVMGGLLLGAYMLVRVFGANVDFPTVISLVLYSTTAIVAIYRGLYLEYLVTRHRRLLRRLTGA